MIYEKKIEKTAIHALGIGLLMFIFFVLSFLYAFNVFASEDLISQTTNEQTVRVYTFYQGFTYSEDATIESLEFYWKRAEAATTKYYVCIADSSKNCINTADLFTLNPSYTYQTLDITDTDITADTAYYIKAWNVYSGKGADLRVTNTDPYADGCFMTSSSCYWDGEYDMYFIVTGTIIEPPITEEEENLIYLLRKNNITPALVTALLPVLVILAGLIIL